MHGVLSILGVGSVVFVSTNVDDLLVLAVLLADPGSRPGAVVAGQFLGIGVLVAASALAALASVAVPTGYPALLGVVPLALGVQRLGLLRRELARSHPSAPDLQDGAEKALRKGGGPPVPPTALGAGSQVLAAAGITIANGGDNLSVYIPLFAREPGLVAWYAAIFAVMTAIWCAAGFWLVRNRLVAARLGRYGHAALPFILIGLGLWILSGARALLRT